MTNLNMKSTCHECGEDIEEGEETHEDEGYIYHYDCWLEHLEEEDYEG